MAIGFKLSPEARTRADAYRDMLEKSRARVANLTDDNLVAHAKLCMANARPMDFAPGEPVYDATLWHVIMPELMRRLLERGR